MQHKATPHLSIIATTPINQSTNQPTNQQIANLEAPHVTGPSGNQSHKGHGESKEQRRRGEEYRPHRRKVILKQGKRVSNGWRGNINNYYRPDANPADRGYLEREDQQDDKVSHRNDRADHHTEFRLHHVAANICNGNNGSDRCCC